MSFDHEKLDVYRLSIDFAALAARLIETLKGDYRNIRDQLSRASQSVPLNIAEGNGKRSLVDRRHYFRIARGSAMECAACLDVLRAIGACQTEEVDSGKALLVRVVAMLSRMSDDGGTAREDEAEYGGQSGGCEPG